MRKLLASIIFGIIPSISHAQMVIPWGNDAISMGFGYDTLRGTVRGQCIDVDPTAPKATAGERVTFHLSSVEDTYQLSKLLSYSAGGSYDGISASVSGSDEVQVNRYSSYLYVSVRDNVRTESVATLGLIVPTLKADASKLLASGSLVDQQTFRERCGNSFTVASDIGGDFTAIVEIHTSSNQEKHDLDVAISGGSGVFSASADAKSHIEELTRNKNVQITVIRGGGGGALVTTPEDLVKAVLNYPVILSGQPSNTLTPYSATLQDYTTLSLPAGVTNAMFRDDEKRDYLEDSARYMSSINQVRADAEYALNFPEQFPSFDKAAFLQFTIDADAVIQDIRRSVRFCLATQQPCGKFQKSSLIIITIPDRVSGPTMADLKADIARSHQALNVVFSDHNRDYICNGFPLSVPGQPPTFDRQVCAQTFNRVHHACDASGCNP